MFMMIISLNIGKGAEGNQRKCTDFQLDDSKLTSTQ